MKIVVIDKSRFFDCNFASNSNGLRYVDYSMKYDLNSSGNSYKHGIKNLYLNKASGVCDDYANYEIMLWKSLDIECYKNSDWNIEHAWSIVKATNSEGKELWIPFDYGIGPSQNLDVSKEIKNKYLKTESMRYELYLDGIEGAPKYKNFTSSDFN